ncbi:DUF4369 domain-containing protein [Reichenbachiella sp. MALMAid0571]|uniref:DUF4369 domain-containing protein n=1 Tax=Reichenbachiella sp. MALMAid0571 TaxID=3143939 RepID=UPI0032DFCBF1
MKQISVAILIGVLLASCLEKKEGFTITGHIDGIKDGTWVKLYDIDQQVSLDSAISKNENFILKGMVDHPTLCWVRCEGKM